MCVGLQGGQHTLLCCCRGVTYSLRPSQIAYVLPGGGYREEDLRTISAAAEAAITDAKLMELAWQVLCVSHTLLAAQPAMCFPQPVHVLQPSSHPLNPVTLKP